MDASQELEAQLERERSERLRLAASLETTAAQLASAGTKLELAERQSVEWKQRAESEVGVGGAAFATVTCGSHVACVGGGIFQDQRCGRAGHPSWFWPSDCCRFVTPCENNPHYAPRRKNTRGGDAQMTLKFSIVEVIKQRN